MRMTLAGFGLLCGLLAGPALAQDLAQDLAEDAAPASSAADSLYRTLEQAPLTADQVQHYIDSTPEMQAATGNLPADAAEPDAATMVKLGDIARRYGFKAFDDYNNVAGNIELTLDGVDPDSKTYIGAKAMIEKSIAEAKADKQMSAADRQAALTELQIQWKTAPTLKYRANIDLVLKAYDKLTAP